MAGIRVLHARGGKLRVCMWCHEAETMARDTKAACAELRQATLLHMEQRQAVRMHNARVVAAQAAPLERQRQADAFVKLGPAAAPLTPPPPPTPLDDDAAAALLQ